MRKIINYTISYFEKGKDLEKKLVISRISRGVIKKYTELIGEITVNQQIADNMKKLQDQIAWILTDTKKKYFSRITECKPLGKQLLDLDKQLKNRPDVLVKCVAIVSDVLDDNGIEDEELCTVKFWDKKTEESDIWDFLSAVVYKDVQPEDPKKKALNMT